MKGLVGKEKYFVHKGTWGNNYRWRIQKVKITGIKINENEEEYAEFGFHCVGYEYPVNYLRDTLREARDFALEQIAEEKKRQSQEILEYTEDDCTR